MDNNLSEIVVVMDRSGSMGSCKEEAESGLNSFIEKQKKEPGQAVFTLAQFNHEYELVYNGVPIAQAEKCFLVPNGMTALFDAVGKTIKEVGYRLEQMKEEDRPGLVMFLIITDGYENSSHEFNKQMIADMIKEQQDKYNWKFSYLGANQDAFAVGQSLNINKLGIANYSASIPDAAFDCAEKYVSRSRLATSGKLDTSDEEIGYTEEERKLMS